MKLRRITDFNEIAGTHFQGAIRVPFDVLVEKLGEPDGPSSDGKVQAEWDYEINGQVCTIYDYKTNREPESNIVWHIGGKSKKALKAVIKFLGKNVFLL
jgi:hypothetical protein